MRFLRPNSGVRRRAVLAVCALALMTLPGISVWATARSIAARSAAAVARAVAPAFGRSTAGTPPPPTITPTMTATLTTDSGGDNKADPGDVIRYTTTIANTGTDATGVNFVDTIAAGTTLVGGSVVISPLAANDTYQSVGNLTLTTATIGADCATNSLHSVTCNDTFNGATLTKFGDTLAHAGNITVDGTNTVTTAHGVVKLNTDGTFVYDPTAGYEGDDEFYYTLSNATITPNLTDVGKVTITVGGSNGMVWFVNSTGAAGAGRQANPFNSLAAFTAVNNGSGTNPAANDTIYLFENGTSYTGSITLLANQKLIGQDATLSPASLNGPAPQPGNAYPSIDPAGSGTKVTLTSAGAGVPTVILNAGNTLAGFTAGHTNGSFAISGGTAGSLSIREVTISSTGGGGFSIGTSAAIVSNATFTGLTSLTATGGSNGVALTGVTGTLSLSGALSGATGTEFAVSGGSATITYAGTITHNTAGQRAIAVSDTTGGSVSFTNAAANSYVSGGTGILIDGAAGNVTISNADLNGSKGIEILGDPTNIASGSYIFNNVTIDTTVGVNNHAFIVDGDQGTTANNKVTATIALNNVDITNPGGLVASIQGMNGGSITFDSASAITRDNGGLGISATSNAGGSVTFNSTTKTLTTNTNAAVSLTNNTGAAFSFLNGTLAITTTSGAGFTAIGGGTVAVTGSNNTINSTAGGAALNITTTTIGSGVTFQSISASAASQAIVLSGTGSGAFTISGTGTAGSGGTIASSSVRGARFSNANNISLSWMTFTGNGADQGTCTDVGAVATNNTDCGAAIDLQTVSGISISNTTISGGAQQGINGNGVSTLTMNNVTVSGAGDEVFENGVTMVNLTGTCSVTNSTFQNSFSRQWEVQNFTGTMNLTISGSAFSYSAPGVGTNAYGFHLSAQGTTTSDTVTVTTSTFTNAFSAGFRTDSAGSATVNATVGTVGNGNTFTNNGLAAQIVLNNSSDTTFDIRANTMTEDGVNSPGSTVAVVKGNPFTGTMTGNIIGNTIGNSNTGSGAGGVSCNSCNAITLQNNGVSGGFNVTVSNNTIQHVRQRAIEVLPAFSDQTKVVITGNTISNPDQATGIGEAIFVQSGANTTDSTVVCATISGNTVTGSWNSGNPANGTLRVRNRFPTSPGSTRFIVSGYADGNAGDDSAAVVIYLTGQNTLSGPVTATAGSGGTFEGPTCPFLLVAEGGVEAACAPPAAIPLTAAAARGQLDQKLLDATVTAAIQRWATTGLTPEQRQALSVLRVDLSGQSPSELGELIGTRIRLDKNAAGHGWYIDPDPTSDAAFPNRFADTRFYADATGTPAGHIDLLTAALHEMGHELGLADSYANADRDSLMYGRLTTGERRLPAGDLLATMTSPAGRLREVLSLFRAPDHRVRHQAQMVVAGLPRGPSGIAAVSGTRTSSSFDFGPRLRAWRQTVADMAVSVARDLRVLARQAANGLLASVEASGETVNVALGTLPANKTITVVFSVSLDVPPVASYANHATVESTLGSFPDVDTNTVTTPGDRYDTTTALVSSLNPSFQGDSITFTATVTPTEGSSLTPDGTIQFKDGVTNLGSPVTCADTGGFTCSAQFTTTTLGTGSRNITADYLGGTNHDPSTSNTVVQVNNACTVNPIVQNNADSGAGSLRQAILDACGSAGSNTITFNMASVVSPIGLTSGELALTKNVIITGPSANLLTVQRTSGTARIFHLNAGKTATISGLTIAGGNATSGAGILNDHGTLTITHSTISGNGTASTSGGGILNDGSTTAASLTILNSTLSGNTASTGGAVSNQGSGGGTATATITNTTISGNTATGVGGGLLNGGTTPTDAVLTLTNSTITNNHADHDNAGAETGGGLSTITSTAVTLRNTIVAGNYTGSGTTTADDISGTVDATSAFNLIGTGGAGGLTNGTNSNQVGVANPGLGPLANNGGPTFTHALLTGSPALDAGDNTGVVIPPFLNTSPSTDQRGTSFPRIRDAADANTTATVDIGALEADPTVEDITDKSTNEDTPLSFSFNIGDSTTAFGTITATSSNTTLLPNANVVVGADTASTRTLTLAPALNQFGTTTITVTVPKTVGGTPLTATDTFVLTVTPVADTPSVTSATTVVNVQTTSGLVISRNAEDGADVGFFKITNITNGALFQPDGTTPIVNNDVIPFAQGNAGLKFTPATDSTAPGSFQVQASVDGIGTGLSTGFATATITVNKHATTTTIVSDNPDDSDRLVPVTVVYTVVSADGGPAPTGTVTVTVSGGSETCSGTVADGQCVITLTVAGVNRTLTASYGGDAVNAVSADTELHTVNNCPATPVVTTTADSGAGSLRQAIADACTTDTITFNIPGPGPDTIGLTTGELTLNKNLTITGPTSKRLTISGTHTSRVFSVAPGTTVALASLTIADGQAVSGAGISSLGDLTIRQSTFTGNTAVGGAGGGFDAEGGTLTILNSTISGNTADTDGGGLLTGGSVTSLLVNVTITNNRADADGDTVGAGGGIRQVSSSPLTLRNTIVAGNVRGTGSMADDVNVLSGSVLDAASAHNLIGVDTGVTGITDGTNGNQIGTAGSPINARLGTLAAHGGPTFTHALLAGSPALEAGDNAFVVSPPFDGPPFTDQRGTGFGRIRDAADADTTATVDIGAVEADPAVEDITDKSTPEETLLSFSFHVGDGTAGPGFDPFTASSSNTTLVPNAPANLNVSGSGSTRTLNITPALNQVGTTTITVTATKPIGGVAVSMSDTFVLTVTAVNDPPTLDAIPDPAAILEDAALQTVNLTGISAGGGETQTLTVTALSNNTALIPHPTVSYTSPNATGSLSYTPVANASGSAIITVTVTDNGGGGTNTFTRTFTVNVTAVNDAPTLNLIPDPPAILEDAALQTVNLRGITAGGGESQTLTVTALSNNTALVPHPTVTYTSPNTTGSLSYTPVANANGSAIITVTVDDGGAGTHTVTRIFTVTVTAVNDQPTIADIPDQQIPAGTSLPIPVTIGDVETAPASLVVTATSSNQTLVPNAGLVVSPGGTSRTLTLTPAANQGGAATITVTVNDGTGGLTSDTFIVTVLPALSIADAVLVEGASGTTNLTFTVSLAGSSASAVSASYTTHQRTAIEGVDYVGVTGTISFTPGATTATILVPIVGDLATEIDETFSVDLSGALGAVLTDAQAVGTIANDDPTSPVTAEVVTWGRRAGVSTNGGSVTQTAPLGWTAGASATKAVKTGGGSVEFSAGTPNQQAVIGLTPTPAAFLLVTDIAFGIELLPDGTFAVVEHGVNVSGTLGSYGAGDRFAVAVTGGLVTYQRNGVTVYTSAGPPLYPLRVDAALFTPGATIADVVLAGRLVRLAPGAGDVDGDGKSDMTVFRPSTGGWHTLKSSTTYTTSQSLSWGLSTDVPAPGDYDGDGKIDPAIYRPSTGLWAILQSSTNYTTSLTVSWGLSTDVPVPADYDGDGRTDPAVYRPSTGGWYILKSSTSYTSSIGVLWGLSTDLPVPGDYDGDGQADPAIYRPSTGLWAILKSSTTYTTSVTVSWGLSTDVAVPGDYDGDGKTDPAVFRPSSGGWFILKSSTNYTSSVSVSWGLSTDIPVPADYDGDGRFDPAIYRPSTGLWAVLKSSTNYSSSFTVSWGLSTDVPINRRP
jgi:hypothetical protein